MSTDPAEAMATRLRADLKEAMRAKRALDVSVLRSLIGALDNAAAVPVAGGHQPYVSREFGDAAVEVPRLRLSADDVKAVFAGEAETRSKAAAVMEGHGRAAEADRLRQEMAVVNRYRDGEASST